jgi:hypothetical protein
VDALIYAKHKDGTKWLIPIEWKYTEDYSNRNKETEAKSEKRKERYTGLINQSDQLKSENHDCYYFEPFYQLMRQTLWAEQMVKNRGEETIQADNYLHLHVVPAENDKLLKKIDTWRSLLKDDTKYRIISPEDFFRHIDTETYKGLIDYLTVRYWKD